MSDSKGARIWRRTIVGAGLVAALVALLLVASAPWGAAFTAVAGAVLAALAAIEGRTFGALPDARATVGAVAATVGVALVVIGGDGATRAHLEHLSGDERYWASLLGALLVAGTIGLCAALPAGDRIGSRVLRTLWIAAPLPLLGLVRDSAGVLGLAALLVLSKIGDIAGYYGGQGLGARFPHHPFPNLSPGKTTVGCACSLLAGTIAGGVLVGVGWLPAGPLGLASGLLAGALVNVAAQAGDLLESAAKRAGRVKDSGAWFGPSGGVLDVVDSLLLASPVAALTWPLVLDLPL